MILEKVERLTPVFVLGPPKSGTSFLAALFDSHPNVISLERTRAYTTRIDPQIHEDSQILSSYYESTPFEKINPALNIDRLKGVFSSTRELDNYTTGGTLIVAMLRSILRQSNKVVGEPTHFVERTAAHAWHIERIIGDFPEAKILFILRDPRAMYLSNKKRQLRLQASHILEENYDAVDFSQSGISRFINFLPLYRSGIAYSEMYRENIKLVIFEELIQKGETQVRNLIEYLGLPWNETLMQPTRHGVVWKGNSQHKNLRGNLRPFDERVLFRWEDELHTFEKAMCESVIKDIGNEEIWPLSLKKNYSWVFRILLPFESEIFPLRSKARGGLKESISAYLKIRRVLLSMMWKHP